MIDEDYLNQRWAVRDCIYIRMDEGDLILDTLLDIKVLKSPGGYRIKELT